MTLEQLQEPVNPIEMADLVEATRPAPAICDIAKRMAFQLESLRQESKFRVNRVGRVEPKPHELDLFIEAVS